jgi:hypothetical protein
VTLLKAVSSRRDKQLNKSVAFEPPNISLFARQALSQGKKNMTKQTVQTIVWNRKREKEHAKIMLLAAKELARMSKPPRLSPAEAREMRALRQRDRRAAKALSEVVL